jgi:hypothetical protein
MEASDQYGTEIALSPRKQPLYLLSRRLRMKFFAEIYTYLLMELSPS